MIARISTTFSCTAIELRREISNPKSLQFVASPMLTFVPVEPGALDREWEVGRDYHLRIYFLGLIPLGRHTIRLESVDLEESKISSRESGLLVPEWNHEIYFQEVSAGLVNYTDEIEIRAGVLTPFIWAFAHVFYRHRQRRWKVLLNKT